MLKLLCAMVSHVGGRQFKITQNDLIVINRIPADVGESIILQKVLYKCVYLHCFVHMCV